MVSLSAMILSAYIAKNAVAPGDLPELLREVHGALHDISNGNNHSAAENFSPIVSAKKSVTPDHVVCLACGKEMRSLKRHLGSRHGLGPDEYRRRYRLPADHPIVAPNYAALRSKLAISSGLGQKVAATRRRRARSAQK